jgi:hypothetical protein
LTILEENTKGDSICKKSLDLGDIHLSMSIGVRAVYMVRILIYDI